MSKSFWAHYESMHINNNQGRNGFDNKQNRKIITFHEIGWYVSKFLSFMRFGGDILKFTDVKTHNICAKSKKGTKFRNIWRKFAKTLTLRN